MFYKIRRGMLRHDRGAEFGLFVFFYYLCPVIGIKLLGVLMAGRRCANGLGSKFCIRCYG